MAIQISGTEVISNSRGLNNIASVDATTAASISAAGVGGGGGTHSFTADGAISAGDTVILNSDGTVSTPSVVSGTSSDALTSVSWTTNNKGTPHANFSSTLWGTTPVAHTITSDGGYVYVNGSHNISGTYTLSSRYYGTSVAVKGTRDVIVFYCSSSQMYYRYLTQSGTSYSAGTETSMFSSSQYPEAAVVYDETNDQYIAVFRENSSYSIMIGTLSGTTMTWGTRTTGIMTGVAYSQATYLSLEKTTGKLVVSSNSNVMVGTVSAGSVSFGTAVVLSSTYNPRSGGQASIDAQGNGMCFYMRGSPYASWGHPFSVSGTTVTAGTRQRIDNYAYASQTTSGIYSYDLDAWPFTYMNSSGATEWDVASSSGSSWSNVSGRNLTSLLGSLNGSYYSGQLAGTDYYLNVDGNGRTTVEYAPDTTDAGDWIGIAAAAISSTASGDITIIGGVNDQQSGLTTGSTYYVGNDGTLQTTNNGRKIGRALSATEILVTEGNA